MRNSIWELLGLSAPLTLMVVFRATRIVSAKITKNKSGHLVEEAECVECSKRDANIMRYYVPAICGDEVQEWERSWLPQVPSDVCPPTAMHASHTILYIISFHLRLTCDQLIVEFTSKHH